VVIGRIEVDTAQEIAYDNLVVDDHKILVFKHGTGPFEFGQAATPENLLEFVNMQCGAQRTLDGVLDKTAGWIQSLDDVIRNADEVTAKAKELGTFAAQYYVKALTKLAQDKEYVAKETARLTKLVENGAVQDDKLDSFMMRRNILNRIGALIGGHDEL
jgi:protein disulfide-isomerase A6